MDNQAIISHFEAQADVCANMLSPFTAKLCRALVVILDETTATGRRVDNWDGDPDADALALRLCGGLHSIVIENPDCELAALYSGMARADFEETLTKAVSGHDTELLKWLDLPPQTNETGRAGALLPGLLEISRLAALPVHLCEIGASAGLNLQLDRFQYDFDGARWGEMDARVRLAPELKGKQPDLSGDLFIRSRIGCDISPIDITRPGEQLRLRSYIWPDQEYRANRIQNAIATALENRVEILEMDVVKFVEAQLAERADDCAFVLMHSVVWQYLDEGTKRDIVDLLNQHGAQASDDSPIYWLRLEGFGGKEPEASLMLDSWPDHRQVKLANSCFHSSWIEFL